MAVELLEREREIALLGDAVRATSASRTGRLVVIEGVAGIGKSSLLAHSRQLGVEAGMRVLGARGSTLERLFGFGVVRQLFEPALARATPADRSELLSGAASLALRVLEEGHPPGGPTERSVQSSMHGLFWLAANLAERQPVLIAVDDLHWSDTPSIQWLGYLMRRVEGLPILVAVAMRPAEPDADVVALSELTADPLATILRPVPLSPEATRRLVAAVLGGEPAEAFFLACYEATAGNPLLLRELFEALAREGVKPLTTEVGRVHEIGPKAVSHSVRLRIRRLPASAQWFVRALAVLGDGSETEIVAALAGIDPSTAADAAVTLAEIDILRRTPDLAFVHPLVREAVYVDVSPGERVAAHDRAANLLAERGATPERVAAHLLAIPRRGRGDVQVFRAAAKQALARSAPAIAAAYLRAALEASANGSERVQVLRQLASLESLMRSSQAEDRLRDVLSATRDPCVQAETQLALARLVFWTQNAARAVDILEQASATALNGGLRELLEAELVGIALSDRCTHAVGAERLARMPEPDGKTTAGKMLLAYSAYLDTYRGRDRERCVERVKQALLDDTLLKDEEASMSYGAAVIALLYADRLDLYEETSRRMRALGRERGAAALFTLGSIGLARTRADRGLLLEAEADARSGLDACPDSQPIAQAYIAATLADVLLKRGDPAGAAAALARAGLSQIGPLTSLHSIRPVAVRGHLHLAMREPAAALADFQAIGELLESIDCHNPAPAGSWRSGAALAHLQLGERDEARRLVEKELPLARAWGGPTAIGEALRTLALVEGGEWGMSLLQESVDVFQRSEARYQLLHSEIELGAALRRANRRSAARSLLVCCLEQAQRSGAGLVAAQAHAELVEAGARPRRFVLTGIDSLTAGERRVATMAARGMSNREIAQALFVTPKTVEMHLGHVFDKLEIHSRTELPARLDGSPSQVAEPVR